VPVTKLKKILPLVCYKDLLADASERTVFLRRKGQSIDLGGIGKGYAADKVLEALRGYGITSAFTNFGGNVAAIGVKPDGSPWKVGLQHPRQENLLIGALEVTDRSVVTSGDYQRYFIGKDGKRYHHILDPITGYPSDSGLISATAVTENSMAADALSTLLFISGIKKGTEILRTFHRAEAVLIDKDLQIYITKGLKNNFQVKEGIQVNVLDI
jgi:thiamine biosynthesis lipoprotein